jgi:TPR repeat protein
MGFKGSQPMNNTPSLSAAKDLVTERRYQEAKAIFERITNERSADSPEAAYCLGIIYQTGSGVPKNVDEAARYYLVAEQSGYPMATYRLGGIYHRRGDLQKAYVSFRSIAQSNPSAAYWAYRLLMIRSQLDSDPDAPAKYLNIAAEQGHVRAQRTIMMRYISGQEGLLKIPHGLRLLPKVVVDIFRVTLKDEKMKYD